MAEDVLNIYTVYERPLDFPEHFVVRRFEMATPTAEFWLGKTLEEVRLRLPPGLYRQPRLHDDHPTVIENWF